MSNCRYKNNDDRLKELIQVLRTIEDTFIEMVTDHTPFIKAAEEHGLNYDRLRNCIRKFEQMPVDHVANNEGNFLMLPRTMPFSPYERAYSEIMQVNYEDLGRFEIPDDFGKALEKAVELVLTTEEAEAFCRYVSGDSLETCAREMQVEEKQVKAALKSAKKKLRNFKDSDILLTEGYAAWEKKQEEFEAQRCVLMEAARRKQEEERRKLMPGQPAMEMHISCLHLSNRYYYALLRAGCNTVGQLWQYIENNSLPYIKYIGPTGADEISQKYRTFIEGQREAEAMLPAMQGAGAGNAGRPMDLEISHLGLSTHAHTALLRAGCHTVEQLRERILKDDLLAIRNIGIKTKDEILEKYNAFMSQPEEKEEDKDAAKEESPQKAHTCEAA